MGDIVTLFATINMTMPLYDEIAAIKKQLETLDWEGKSNPEHDRA